MRKIFYTCVIMTLAFTGAPAHSADGWMKFSKLKSTGKKMRKKGMIATSVSCRNSPKAKVAARPEILITWAKGDGSRDWVIMTNKGSLFFQPNYPGKPKVWRRVNGQKFVAGPANTRYRCDLWHR